MSARARAVVMLAVVGISIPIMGAAAGAKPVLAGSQSPLEQRARVVVPNGARHCPNSGLGASCSYAAVITPDMGVASLPPGLAACAGDQAKSTFGAVGACTGSTAPSQFARVNDADRLRPTTPQIELSADKALVGTGAPVLLSASTSISATGTPWALEVFDQTTQALVGACSTSTACQVSFAAKAGTHTFIAYLAEPSLSIPVQGIRLQSATLNVKWLEVMLAASDPSVVGPGREVIFTATASVEVGEIGYQIQLFDTTAGEMLTFCTQGTTCTTSLIEPEAGTHRIVASLIPAPGLQQAQETSAPVSATWLRVVVAATPYPLQGGTTTITATANADLATTEWAIFIFMSPDSLIGNPCAAASCTTSLALHGTSTPSFFAVVASKDSVIKSGSVSVQLGQARSVVVIPARTLWGVDSCAAFTQDPAGSTGLLGQVSSKLGTPDFWGRYLPTTANCPALSQTELAAARNRHIGILPIYNDYDCSAVSGYSAGSAYAVSAVQIAIADQMPLGTGIAIDIEPPGDACPGAANVDEGFITGWYDGITTAGYAPVYYGNSTPQSAFGSAWCAAVAARPEIAAGSYLWSFEPDLIGGFTRRTAPAFAPYDSGCAGNYDAWQYRISDGSTPDVDHDEATNQLPIWYP